MDCYAYALIAAGQIDLVIEAGLQAYDVQAPIAVIEAAGGIVTDWQGRPCRMTAGRMLAAANARTPCRGDGLLNGWGRCPRLPPMRGAPRDICPASKLLAAAGRRR
jgi:hypothetical protein